MKKVLIILLICCSNSAFSQELTDSLSLKVLNKFVCDNWDEFEPYVLTDKQELFLALECTHNLGMPPETLYQIKSNCKDITLKIWPADYVFFDDIESTIIFNECTVEKDKVIFKLQFWLNNAPGIPEYKTYEVRLDRTM